VRTFGLPRAVRSRKVWLAVVGSVGIAAASTVGIASAATGPAAVITPDAVFNVRDFGATGNGSTNDTPAIERAINAAAGAGGGTVEFPSGTYRAGGTIHLKSNITIMLDSGSKVTGSSSGYDAPESNPNDSFQDFGHSHFHDAMFYGDRLNNIGFVGSGTIDGNNNLITGNPSSGQADKIISLTRCTNLTLNGITLRQGGHFAILINGCNGVTSDHLNIQTATDRDGWNIINTSNVTITNITDFANDDALVFKSDWALGTRFTDQGHVRVTHANLGAGCCNALMFGSETCSDFKDYVFDDITINGSSKSGIGMVSMDGANISDVHYKNITVSNVASPIMQKIGTRNRCGDHRGVGHIDNITYDNITIVGKSSPQYSPTIWGADSSHRPTNVSFNNVKITVPGGSANIGTGVPSNDPNNYNPNSIGKRPAYGWYIHNASNISFTGGSSVEFNSGDARPAVIADTGSTVTFDGFKAERSTGSTDMVFKSINPYCVRNSTNTAGGALRITATSSTQQCPSQSSDFSLSVAPASQTVSPGGTATINVSTAVVSGTPGSIALSASGAPAGSTPSFSTNPVPAGGTSTLTVPVPSDASGSFTITVTGTAGTATHSASATITVGTSGGLTISGLTVADTTNAADWSLQTNLHVGSVQYGDRTFTCSAVPAALTGQQWIRTANDSKGSTANPLVRFTISTSATVAVAVDTRIGRRSWMDSTWADTGTSIRNNESTPRTFEVFTKTFPAGQVSLGPNGNTSSSMYMIVVF
jgi:polygalacturonase